MESFLKIIIKITYMQECGRRQGERKRGRGSKRERERDKIGEEIISGNV